VPSKQTAGNYGNFLNDAIKSTGEWDADADANADVDGDELAVWPSDNVDKRAGSDRWGCDNSAPSGMSA